MTTFTFDNRWDQVQGKLKQRYGQLTDDDLAFAEGKGEELLGRLRQKLGLSPEELDNVLNELRASAGGALGGAREKASDVADAVRHKAAAASEEVRAQASAAYDRTRQQARGLWEDGEQYVRQNPRESLIAALCAGFVAGLLIRH